MSLIKKVNLRNFLYFLLYKNKVSKIRGCLLLCDKTILATHEDKIMCLSEVENF